MPRIVVTHAVKDLALWVSKHAERVTAFGPFGSDLTDHVNADGSRTVAVTVNVHDLAGLQKMLQEPKAAALKAAHGVVEPLTMFIAKS
jgi:hypothetical protein